MSRGLMTSVRWAFNSAKWHPDKAEWRQLAQYVQAEEKDRIGRFMFKRDAKASMVGRVMLRRLIHRVTSIPYTEIRLGRTDKGKPFLQNELPCQSQLSFNVSHQGEYVVLAAETDCEVGVDVMNSETPRGRSLSDFFHTMRNQFTEEEWACITASSVEADQLRTFYRLWCLKESYVKALGIGIGFEVKRLNFDLATRLLSNNISPTCSTTLRVDGELKTDWTFEETLIDDHCVVVACNRSNKDSPNSEHVPFTILTSVELMQNCVPLSEQDDSYAEAFIEKDEDPFSRRKMADSER